MVCSWNIELAGVILILNQMTSLIRSCDQRVPYFPVYYPELGKYFILDVLHDGYHNSTWRKDGKPLAVGACNGHNDPNCTHPIYLASMRAGLSFRKIALEDSGKYILELFCRDESRRVNSFEIIVRDKPSVHTDCNDMTVTEGDNVTCVCKTTIGYPTAVVTWLWTKPEQGNSGVKHFTDILTLENISENESGTYTCVAKSQNMVNKTSFNLKVLPRISTAPNRRVQIKYFDIFQQVVAGHSKLSLLCKADGIPQPRYTILHNGTAVEFGNIYTVDTENISSLGQYECLASNTINSDGRSLFLNASFLGESKEDKRNLLYKASSKVGWKIGLMVGGCSFLTGMLFVCILVFLCKRCGKNDDRHENSVYDDVSPAIRQPQSANEGLGPNEMGLRHASLRPENEETRHSEVFVVPINDENMIDHVYYNEGHYQELSDFRDKDEKYQSLRFNRSMNA